MRTSRERTSRGRHTYNRESGVVGLILLALIVVAIAVAAFSFVARKQDKTVATDTQNTTSSEGSFQEDTPLKRNQVNTQRRADAAALLSNTSEYANNNGSLPQEVHAYMLNGLDYYSTASLATGEQSPIITDELRLVLGATCAGDGSTAAGSSRAYAVQFGLRDLNDGETFNPECENG